MVGIWGIGSGGPAHSHLRRGVVSIESSKCLLSFLSKDSTSLSVRGSSSASCQAEASLSLPSKISIRLWLSKISAKSTGGMICVFLSLSVTDAFRPSNRGGFVAIESTTDRKMSSGRGMEPSAL